MHTLMCVFFFLPIKTEWRRSSGRYGRCALTIGQGVRCRATAIELASFPERHVARCARRRWTVTHDLVRAACLALLSISALVAAACTQRITAVADHSGGW